MIGRILPIILILIAIGLFAGYINPVYSTKITPLKAEIHQYDSTLAAANDFNRKEAELARERNSIPNESIQRLETYLPDGVDNVQLILDLNALAAKSGMQLSNFDIKSSVSAPNASGGALPLQSGGKAMDSLDLTVKATGSYGAFRTFLAGLEQSLRPMDIVQMSLADSQTGVYTYNITFRIYWLH
jgi:Tfp pilus assembly protein PilO